jgi:hypothetical protein
MTMKSVDFLFVVCFLLIVTSSILIANQDTDNTNKLIVGSFDIIFSLALIYMYRKLAKRGLQGRTLVAFLTMLVLFCLGLGLVIPASQ